MLNLQLYIEGQEVDLFQDESVTLTQTIQDVKDIEKVFTDFSRTFNVPASKTNNKIFKHFYNYHIIGFDARKKKDAELYLNYKLFKKGKIKLEGTTRQDNKAHTYRLTFFGNGINLKDLIGDDKLDALSMLKESVFTFTYNDDNIQTYMQNGLDVSYLGETYDDAIIFPLLTHTKRLVYDSSGGTANSDTINNIAYQFGSNNGLQLSQLKPALRLYPILKAIEKQYGITFSTDFFSKTNPVFYNLYLWLHNKTGGLFEDEGNVSPVGDFTLGYVKGATIDLYRNYFRTPQADQVGKDAGNKERRMDVTITPSVSDPFNFIIFKNGEVFKRYDNIQRDATTGEYRDIRGLVLEAGNYTFGIESNTPSTYNFKVYIERNPSFPQRNEVFFTGYGEVLTDVQFRFTNQLPEFKVIDFITSLFKMFNLTSFQNDEGVIEVKTLDNYYASSTKTWDITKYIDKTESTVDSVLPYKQVDFRYEGQDNFFAKNHNELFNQEWGTLQYKASEKFEGEVYTITVPLEHFKYERLKDVSGGSFTNLQWGWSTDIKQSPNLGKPLFFYAIQQNATIGVIEANGTLVEHTGVYIPSNSLTLLNSQNLNFNAEINEYGLIPYETTLFDTYYKNYVKEIFDPQRRLTNIKAYLPLSVTMNLSLADKVRIFDNLYRINKLTTNFETNQSSLELINVKEDAGATIEVNIKVPDKFVPINNDIRVDSDNITADNTLIRVDSGQVFDGVDVISTAEYVPVTVFPTNDVIQTNNNIPLVVTAPELSNTSAFKPNTTTSAYLRHAVITLGKLGNVNQIDEYGFLYSLSPASLSGSNDIDFLKTSGGVTAVEFFTTELNKYKPTYDVFYEVTGLSSGTTVYYRFYGRTNINTDYAFGDAISSVLTSVTL